METGFLTERIKNIFIPIVLFIATVATTLWVGGISWNAGALENIKSPGILDILHAGAPYALPLIAILLCHEMGHFIAGRMHGIMVSPPYFIPVPFALGTMGAVIIYRSKVGSAKKLLDIAVAGPISGIVASTVLMIVGLKLSTVGKLAPGMGIIIQEGQSLYYMFLKWIVLGKLPPGYDVFLHPVAWSAWVGLFVTMINLIPIGQLDGGHVAYALFNKTQNKISLVIHITMIVFPVVIGIYKATVAIKAGQPADQILGEGTSGGFWLIWALVLYIIKKLGRGYHPPLSEQQPLNFQRKIIAIATLIFFIFLFMPIPLKVIVI